VRADTPGFCERIVCAFFEMVDAEPPEAYFPGEAS